MIIRMLNEMNHLKMQNQSNSRSNLEAQYHKYVNISFPGAYSLQPNVSSLIVFKYTYI